jgi:hypothetical protein
LEEREEGGGFPVVGFFVEVEGTVGGEEAHLGVGEVQELRVAREDEGGGRREEEEGGRRRKERGGWWIPSGRLFRGRGHAERRRIWALGRSER